MNTDNSVSVDPLWLMNESLPETTTPDPYPHVEASYKWLAVAGGIIVVIFIAAVAAIVIKVRRKNKEKSPPAIKRWKPPARCSSLPENDKAIDTPSLPSLEYRDPADLIQDYTWYSIDKPRDDSDVLNISVQPPRSPKKSPSQPTSPTVSFSDEVSFRYKDETKESEKDNKPAKTVSSDGGGEAPVQAPDQAPDQDIKETVNEPDETPECYDTYL